MRRSTVILTLVLLISVPAVRAVRVRTSADDSDRLMVLPAEEFAINCTLEDSDAPGAVVVSWYRSAEDGDRVKLKSTDRVKTAGDTLAFREPSPNEDPANYTCSFAVGGGGGADPEATVQVIANVTVKLPGISINRMEGDDLSIHCEVHGKPWPIVYWTKNSRPLPAAIPDASSRLTLQGDSLGFPDTRLSLSGLRYPADAGDFCCHAENVANEAFACIIVRVKSKYAALWPVLGILAELLVLAAFIIFCDTARKGRPVMEDGEPEAAEERSQPAEQAAGDVRQRK